MCKFLPSIKNETKTSTAICAVVFEEMDAALDILDLARKDLTPVQRELVDRFIAECQLFANNMLAAEGNPDAQRAVFGLPAAFCKPVNQAGT